VDLDTIPEKHNAPSKTRRAAELLIEIGIGIGLVLFIIWDVYSEIQWPEWVSININIFLMTALIFGYALKWYRRSWRSLRFWAAFGGLFIIHLSIFMAFFKKWAWGPLALISMVELPLICFALERAGAHPISDDPDSPTQT
jgi:hypothetical protein